MESVQLQYEERDIDLDVVRKIASDSAKRIERDYETRLKKAIRDNDMAYISRELRNVSTFELLKMAFHKLF